jgi:hypothetical protein
MTIDKRPSLRKCINDHCKCCIYDPDAAGTWRQQVTLCSVTLCPLYPARPTTKAPIPESALNYYDVTGAERAQYACSVRQERRVGEGNLVATYPSKDAA